MDTESRYLRDIRDAIKGLEKRSSMDVSGNSKTKYLKDIADAIRDNGGGGKDGNDKVKQTPVVPTEQSFDNYNVLLSGSNTNFSDNEITEGARKSSGFEYHANKTQLLVRNKECYTYGYTNDPNIGVFYGKEVDHVYSSKGAMLLTDDVKLSGTDNTWDGTNSSLKSALATAKDVFIVNMAISSHDEYTNEVLVNYITFDLTDGTATQGSQSYRYADKSYDDIYNAHIDNKVILLKDADSTIYCVGNIGLNGAEFKNVGLDISMDGGNIVIKDYTLAILPPI